MQRRSTAATGLAVLLLLAAVPAAAQGDGGPFGRAPAPAAGLLPLDGGGVVEAPERLVGLAGVRAIEAGLAAAARTCRPWADGASVVVRHRLTLPDGGTALRVAEPLRSDAGAFTGRRVWYVVDGRPVAARHPFGWWLFDRAGLAGARLDAEGGLRRLEDAERFRRGEVLRARLDALLLGFWGSGAVGGADPALCEAVGGPVAVPADP
jgi:hypothetical protein